MMSPLSPPVRVGRFEPIILADAVICWGPTSAITARPAKHRIIVEVAPGVVPLRREPRC